MADEMVLAFDSGNTVYGIIRRRTDQYVYNGTTFAVWNNSNITTYDVAMTDRGGDYYTSDFPVGIGAGTYDIVYYQQVGVDPTITDEIIGSQVLDRGVVAATGTASVGTNISTVGELRTILQTFARNAGIIDSGNLIYLPATADYAIQNTLNTFIDRTKCTMTTATITMAAAASTIDFSGIVGFSPYRLMRLWAVPSTGTMTGSPEIDIIDMDRIDTYRARFGDVTGHPGAIGFPLQDGTSNKTAQTADVEYTVKARHYATLVAWTPGDAGASSTVINIPGDFAREAIEIGGVMRMQGQEIEHLPITDRRRQPWEDLIQRASKIASLSVRSVRRLSVDDVRAERFLRAW
jgi:hypothetical protein